MDPIYTSILCILQYAHMYDQFFKFDQNTVSCISTEQQQQKTRIEEKSFVCSGEAQNLFYHSSEWSIHNYYSFMSVFSSLHLRLFLPHTFNVLLSKRSPSTADVRCLPLLHYMCNGLNFIYD